MSKQRTSRLSLLSLVLLALSMATAPGTYSPIPAQAKVLARSATPVAAAARPTREIFGFALASSLGDPTVGYTTWNFSLLSTVAFFGLHINDDGTIASDAGWSTWNNTSLRGAFLNAAHSSGARVVVSIVLQDFGAGTPHMCSGLAHSATTVAAAVAQVKAAGFDGLNVDYEGLNGSCGTSDPSWARHALTSFVGSLRSALPSGSNLSVDTYASSAADPLGFFDVQAMAPAVDSFFVMAYDLEYSNYQHPPLNCVTFCLGPTAPLSGYYYNDTSTAQQYAGAVGASKVVLGVPYYGRKACVAGATPNAYPVSGGSVAADSYLDAAGEESYYLVQPGSYVSHRDANDPAGQERWDSWYNTQLKCTRELYYDDALSLGHKYDLVNQDNLRGVGIWTLNYGGGATELWNALATHFLAVPEAPTDISACAQAGSAVASWSPANPNGTAITGYRVTANPGGASVTVPATATEGTVTGLAVGTPYTLTVQAINAAGPGVGTTSAAVTPVASMSGTGYFNWYDNASPGVGSAAFNVVNTGSTPATGCIALSGRRVVGFSLAPGAETHLSFPAGTIGGPVIVGNDASSTVRAWLRTQYYQSISEMPARPAIGAGTLEYFPWYDLASPGAIADTFHIYNISALTATGTIAMPGVTPIQFSVPSGADGYYSFPHGTIGGPVTVSSSQPVMASLRAWYYQSLSEMPALHSFNAGTTLYLPWYDLASPGTVADTIHITDISSSVASGTIQLPKATAISFTVQPGHDGYFSFPAGTVGGPVTINSSQPVLATLRAWYYQSLSEVWAKTAGAAGPVVYFSWYDKASAGVIAQTIHITNVSGTAATGTITVPGASAIPFSVANNQDGYYSFPQGTQSGPLIITASQPVIASLREWYYQSLTEIPSG